MRAAERPYAAAGAALLVAGAITAAPVVPRPAGIPVVSQATRLVADEGSLLNVPLNLFYDFVNIPYNEIQAIDFAARSLFFSGPWFVVSPTNLWGVDPGDPSHFQSILNFLIPFPELSGMNSPETDFDAGLGQQEWGLAAAMVPVSDWCDAADCVPVVPTSPITGGTVTDFFLWLLAIGTFQEKFPLIDNWLTPPSLFELASGYTFDSDYPGYVDPSGPAYAGFGFPGTTDADGVPDTPDTYDTSPHLMPWSNDTFQLNLFAPFENFFQSLMAPPPTDGIFGTGIQFLNPVDFGRAVQALLGGLVLMFDPLTPGSPFCPGDCTFITDAHLDYPDIIKAIGAAWPGNPIIDEWETALANGTANVPTEDQIQRAIEELQQGYWDFQNPSPPPDWSFLFNPSSLAPFFHELWTDLGFNPPPLSDEIATPDTGEPDVPDPAAGTDLFNVDWADLLNPANWT